MGADSIRIYLIFNTGNFDESSPSFRNLSSIAPTHPLMDRQLLMNKSIEKVLMTVLGISASRSRSCAFGNMLRESNKEVLGLGEFLAVVAEQTFR